jgi:serine/threonine-protein kinase RsbW
MSDAGSGSQRLVLPSEYETLERVDEILLGCEHFKTLDGKTQNEVALAMIEAVTNAVVHGNRLDKDKKVTVNCEWDPDEIRISVHDEGEGFDESCVWDPTDEEHCMKCSGRGVFIMRATMDEVEFEMSEETGTTVRMRKITKGAGDGTGGEV